LRSGSKYNGTEPLAKVAFEVNLMKISRSFYGKMFLSPKNLTTRSGLMKKISQVWGHIQATLFPFLEEELGPLTEKEKKLSALLELIQIENFLPARWWSWGRPSKDRSALAKAFVAKMVYNLSTTSELIERLHSAPIFRRLCGWERSSQIPSEATFSRSFKEFADSELPFRAHHALIREYEGDRLVGHLSRDATDIEGREKPAPQAPPKTSARKRGRPRRGESRPARPPRRLERQPRQSLDEMLADLPRSCDWGTKKKNGKTYHWKGYKLHVDWADGEIPISPILTSASVNDSQVAIPLAVMSASRVESLYDLMDAAYDAEAIRVHSLSLGHVPIIDRNPRGGEKVEMEPARKRRYDERSTAERGYSLFKEDFGGRHVRVRGPVKVMAHLLFGLLALTADRLMNLLL
jgi:hypothetical protein